MWNKTKEFKRNTKEKNKTQKYHKAVLKSICISTDIYFQITKLNLKYVLA